MKISLASARINAKLTQKNVAKEIGVSTYTISRWENGKIAPDIYQALKLSKLYNIDLNNLFFLV